VKLSMIFEAQTHDTSRKAEFQLLHDCVEQEVPDPDGHGAAVGGAGDDPQPRAPRAPALPRAHVSA
jgi:hypothetical protein